MWQQVAREAAAEFRADQVSIIASGVAFRATLAVFPGIAVLVWIGSQFMESRELHSALLSASATMPESMREIIGQAMNSQLARDPGANSFLGFVGPGLALLFAAWSANSGVKAMFIALNTIFDRTEERSFVCLTLITLMFTGGALILSLFAVALIVLGPSLLSWTGISQNWLAIWDYLRWPALLAIATLGIGLLYRYAPNRGGERWSIVTYGGFAAALALTGCSAAFSWVVARFTSLSITYGSLSTLVAFMIWLWLSTTLALAGAEIDAALKRHAEGKSSRARSTLSQKAASSDGSNV